MRRKNFVGSSNDVLQAVINENVDRKCLSIKSLSGTHDLETSEDQPVAILYDPNHFVPIEEVPESLEDEELRLDEMIDEKNEIAHEDYQILAFSGKKPEHQFPKFVVMVKKCFYPNKNPNIKAACFDAKTGLLVCIY